MNRRPSWECQQVCEQLTSTEGSPLPPELLEHLAYCDECRRWDERTRTTLDELRKMAAVLEAIDPAPVTGPWQEQPLVETAGPSAVPARRSSSKRRGMSVPGAWLAAVACVTLAAWAVQYYPPNHYSGSTASSSSSSTLLSRPLDAGRPSPAGLVLLAQLELPATCVSFSDERSNRGSSDGLVRWPEHAHRHQATFDCCTRCHAASTHALEHHARAHQLLTACGICHDVAQSHKPSLDNRSYIDCSACHHMTLSAKG